MGAPDARVPPRLTGVTVQRLEDRYGRVAADLRVSLTDRCNLRCSYCMPAEGLDWMPNEEVLTDEEVVHLIRIGVQMLGIREVRFTGGEPLVRRGLVDIVAGTRALDPDLELSITTNALGLTRMARTLADAGLDRVNVSLDTVRPDTFHQITRRDRFADVVSGLEAAKAAGLGPVKINAVLLRGVNDDQAPELLRWCLERGYDLRFIEQMPLDAQHGWSREGMVTADEIFDRLGAEFDLSPAEEPRGSAPAELFRVDGGPATVGVIASVTRPFCGDCDRVRLTADGQVRNCLFAREESDLRGRPARRRLRRGDRGPLGGRHARQAGRPRHRRPVVPPARPPDVRHRGLTDHRRVGADVRPSHRRVGADVPGRRVESALVGDDVLEEAPGAEEVRQRRAVLVARQPGLAALRGVQLRVVPEQRPGGVGLAAAWRSSGRSRHCSQLVPTRECAVPDGHGGSRPARSGPGRGRPSLAPQFCHGGGLCQISRARASRSASTAAGSGRGVRDAADDRSGCRQLRPDRTGRAQLEAVAARRRSCWPAPRRCTAAPARRR